MEDIVGWDVRTWSKAVEFWDLSLGSSAGVLQCLEIGAGPGGPSLWLAARGHTVICSNWEAAEAQAAPLHKRVGASNITYQDIDAMHIPYENHFDLIVFKSVLGGVGPLGVATRQTQQLAMNEILKALKPGGRLLFAENLRGTVLHRAARAISYLLRRAHWRFVTLAEMRHFLSGFSSYELYTTGVLALFGLKEGQRRALARADNLFLNRIVPRSWRYVVYGMAIK